MARLKHEAVTSSWNALVIQGAGKEKWVMDRVEKMIKDANMGFFAYPPIRYISALYPGVAHEAGGTLR
jgi:hypothetical protein